MTSITSHRPKAQPHVAINDGSTLLISAFNHHHHLSRPLPRLSQAYKASKKVSNEFYNLLHALLTIAYPTGILELRRSFDELPTPPHTADQSGVVQGYREGFKRRTQAAAYLLPSRRDVRAVPPSAQVERVVFHSQNPPPLPFPHQRR